MQMKLKGNEVYRITHAWYRNKKNKNIVFELEEIVNDGGIKGRDTRRIYFLKELVILP